MVTVLVKGKSEDCNPFTELDTVAIQTANILFPTLFTSFEKSIKLPPYVVKRVHSHVVCLALLPLLLSFF